MGNVARETQGEQQPGRITGSWPPRISHDSRAPGCVPSCHSGSKREAAVTRLAVESRAERIVLEIPERMAAKVIARFGFAPADIATVYIYDTRREGVQACQLRGDAMVREGRGA
jgi:hypothetical protein